MVDGIPKTHRKDSPHSADGFKVSKFCGTRRYRNALSPNGKSLVTDATRLSEVARSEARGDSPSGYLRRRRETIPVAAIAPRTTTELGSGIAVTEPKSGARAVAVSASVNPDREFRLATE